jgi:hypothetical protein
MRYCTAEDLAAIELRPLTPQEAAAVCALVTRMSDDAMARIKARYSGGVGLPLPLVAHASPR